jgi:hypothetical protein
LKVVEGFSGRPKKIQIYLDSGVTDHTGGDDGAVLTARLAAVLREKGWSDENLLHFVDQPLGADALRVFQLPEDKFSEAQRSQHNELYWRLRAWRALSFLFPPVTNDGGS